MTKQASLTDLIRLDIKYCRTPDLPALRYEPARIPVFLYDNMKDSVNAKAHLYDLQLGIDWSTQYNFAVTKEKYVPWYSLHESDNYEALCLEDPLDAVYTDVEDYCLADPLPIMGKIVYVSIHALEELDYYYDNEYCFDRVKIEVHPSPLSKKTKECFAYFNQLEGIATWDETKKEYKLNANISTTPFNEVTKAKRQVYSM